MLTPAWLSGPVCQIWGRVLDWNIQCVLSRIPEWAVHIYRGFRSLSGVCRVSTVAQSGQTKSPKTLNPTHRPCKRFPSKLRRWLHKVNTWWSHFDTWHHFRRRKQSCCESVLSWLHELSHKTTTTKKDAGTLDKKNDLPAAGLKSGHMRSNGWETVLLFICEMFHWWNVSIDWHQNHQTLSNQQRRYFYVTVTQHVPQVLLGTEHDTEERHRFPFRSIKFNPDVNLDCRAQCRRARRVKTKQKCLFNYWTWSTSSNPVIIIIQKKSCLHESAVNRGSRRRKRRRAAGKPDCGEQGKWRTPLPAGSHG